MLYIKLLLFCGMGVTGGGLFWELDIKRLPMPKKKKKALCQGLGKRISLSTFLSDSFLTINHVMLCRVFQKYAKGSGDAHLEYGIMTYETKNCLKHSCLVQQNSYQVSRWQNSQLL